MNHWSSSPGGLVHILVLEALRYQCIWGNSIPCVSTLLRVSLKLALIPQGQESQEIPPLVVPASFSVLGNGTLTGLRRNERRDR